MRCENFTEQLLLLAYEELPDAEATACRKHLAECTACRERLAELRDTQQLLDLAPGHSPQLDLAKVCLRFAARERRAVLVRRWTWGIVAAAASVAAIAAVRWLDVRVEPGRLTVAWQSSVPAVEPPVGARPGQGGDAALAHDAATGTAPGVRDVLGADRWLDADDSLASLYARRWANRAQSTAGSATPGPNDAQAVAAPLPVGTTQRLHTYGDLRRELLNADNPSL